MFGLFAVLAGGLLLAVGVGASLSGSVRRRPGARLHPDIKTRTREWATLVAEEADGRVDTSLVLGVIARESAGNPNALGVDGERGLMQLTEGAVIDYMRENADPDVVDFDSVLSTRENVRVGAWYLARKIEEMGSRYHGLRAYNCGTVGARRNESCGADYARWILEVAEPEFRTVA